MPFDNLKFMSMTKKTCLNDAHRALGANMVDFAGFDMPLEYKGLVDEHVAVRTDVGVFDVSHMGEIVVAGKQAAALVNHVFTNDVDALAPGKIQYGMMLHPTGGTVDDLLVYQVSADVFLLVVNASNIEKDYAHILKAAEGYDVTVTNVSDECGQLAVQGPNADKTLAEVLDIDASELAFYTFKIMDRPEGRVLVSRTGYTGEDGFEIYAAPAMIVDYWEKLMAAGVMPCGLGCRDTLRFEAGLPLYGDELTDDISPVEACFSMFVKFDKPDGFIGADVVRAQKMQGPARKLVGLEIDSPAPARHGYEVLDADGNVIGAVTTGYRSITLGRTIAMALVDARFAALGTQLQVRIRRRTVPATVIRKRFYTPQYKK